LEPAFITHVADTAVHGITSLHEAGATTVELFMASARHFDPARPAQVEAVRAALVRTGLRPAVAHLCFGEDVALSATDPVARDAAVQRHLMEMRVAASLGSPVVVVHPGYRVSDESARASHLAASAEALSRLAHVAEELGLDLAVENMPPGYLGATTEELYGLVDGLGSPRAGFCLDTGHAFLAGIPLDGMARAFGSRLFAVHWQDNDGIADQHRIPGAGVVPWTALFAALDEIAYDRPVTLEAAPSGMLLSEFVRLTTLALAERRPLFA
jgi:sugar phosphate isomerase/epimerase